MTSPTIDIDIRYLADADEECPYIRSPAVPRVGEIIVTPTGKPYMVEKVIWDDTIYDDKLAVVLEVTPHLGS